MEIDKQNDGVAFNDASHTYWNLETGQKYISVTTLVGKFEQPYDKDFWSSYKALEQILPKDMFSVEKKRLLDTKKFDIEYYVKTYDLDVTAFNLAKQKILDDWQQENSKSCERGTAIHAGIENGYLDEGICELKKYGLGGKFVVRSGDVPLDEEKGVYPEYLIHVDDGDLHLAGQIDLLIKDGDDVYIYDWKGLPLDTPIATPEGYTQMKDLQVGDRVFDKDGKICNVIVKSEIHNNPCYKITFDTKETIVADADHRWLVHIDSDNTDLVLTTLEIKNLLGTKEISIKNSLPIDMPEADLPIAPFTLGCWLWGSNDITALEAKILNSSDLHDNKHIPDEYLRASLDQRRDLLAGIWWMSKNVDDSPTLVIEHPWQREGVIKLLGSLGYKFTELENGNIKYSVFEDSRIIESVEQVETVQTQCIQVDSPSHTYLAGYAMIVTHNTNKEIKTKGFFDKKTKSTVKMKYPLNSLDDANFSHYTMQVSIYAWMLQHNHPNLNVKRLKLVHFDHKGNTVEYDIEYKKPLVERLLRYWGIQQQIERKKELRKEIVF